MPRVVVTGIAGALGSRVVARLLERDDVESIVGLDMKPFDGNDPRLETRVVDLSSPARADDAALEQLFVGADSVLHLAWQLPDGHRARRLDAATAAAANLRALTRVLALADRAQVARIVHVSSATVYGAWPDNKIPLTEDARIRPNPEFSFAVSKAEAERVVAEWADRHQSVTVAVLRPAVTVGSGERPLYQALGISRSPGSGESGRPVQYLHVDDLVAAVLVAWEKGLRGVYNVAPDSGISEEHARALVGGLARLSLPSRVAAAVSSLGWRLWRRGVPVEARAYAAQPWVVAADRLKAAGWFPAYSSEEALVATDERLHWDDLPPARRQNLNLLVAAVALVVVGGGVALGVAALRRRRR